MCRRAEVIAKRAAILLLVHSVVAKGQATSQQEQRWHTIITSGQTSVAVDTGRIDPRGDETYVVFLRSNLTKPLLWMNKMSAAPFNRQVFTLVFRCNPVAIKIARTSVSLGDEPPIDSTGPGLHDVDRLAWSTPDGRLLLAQAVDRVCLAVGHKLR